MPGHSRSGSASQEGLGKLPAIVVGNIAASCRRSSTPSIQPVILREQPFPAKRAQADVAKESCRPRQVIHQVRCVECRALCACRACQTGGFVGAKARAGSSEDRASSRPRTTASSIAIAAPCARNGSIGCAASPQERDRTLAPSCSRRPSRDVTPRLGACQQFARLTPPLVCPKSRRHFVARRRRTPCAALPRAGGHGDDVDHLPGCDGVVHEMRAGTEPQRHLRFAP